MKRSITFLLSCAIAIHSFAQTIELPDTTVEQGTIVHIPVRIQNLPHFVAADIQISYDSTIVKAIEPSLPIELVENGFQHTFNIYKAGLYRLYIAGEKPYLDHGGIIAHLSFIAIGKVGESTLLNCVQFDVNEISQKDIFQQGRITIKDFNIPNAFTPNNDGYNDVFEIPVLAGDMATISVFNQNGQLVYHATDRIKWDGTANGSPLPQATYFYILQMNQKRIKGTIRLMR